MAPGSMPKFHLRVRVTEYLTQPVLYLCLGSICIKRFVTAEAP